MSTCRKCIHRATMTIPAQGDWLERKVYSCHRFPPVNGQGWPDVELEDFCGEFKSNKSNVQESK